MQPRLEPGQQPVERRALLFGPSFGQIRENVVGLGPTRGKEPIANDEGGILTTEPLDFDEPGTDMLSAYYVIAAMIESECYG